MANSYNAETIQNILKYIKSTACSVTEASKKFHIPRSTLRTWLKNKPNIVHYKVPEYLLVPNKGFEENKENEFVAEEKETNIDNRTQIAYLCKELRSLEEQVIISIVDEKDMNIRKLQIDIKKILDKLIDLLIYI